MSNVYAMPDRESPREIVAAEVRAGMARARLSGSRLGKLTGKSQTYWWRRLAGEVPFDVDDLSTIAALLGVSMRAFIPENENPRPVDPDGGTVRHQGLEPRTRWISVFAGEDERTYTVAASDPAEAPEYAQPAKVLEGPWAPPAVAA